MPDTASANSETVDALLIGSGIMSGTLAGLLKHLQPDMSIELYEAADQFAQEASYGWHNAGTGHAGICEVSYTPFRGEDGEVDVAKAISIFNQFERSKQFWGFLARQGIVSDPSSFVNQVPHVSFVFGQNQVDFLRSRYNQLKKHHFFESMQYTEDRAVLEQWAPLLLEGRDPQQPVAATKMDAGTDVNFGSLANQLVQWLDQQDGCAAFAGHRVVGLKQQTDGRWQVTIQKSSNGQRITRIARFVFIGAGGGSVKLLQKAGIPEFKGFGGFPIAGQWLVCRKPELVEQHHAKVYGMSPDSAPTLAVPHLDTRVIDGEKAILFGPYGSWTTKFLHRTGKFTDMFTSARPDNIGSMVKVGLHNIPLIRYLMQQSLQSMNTRMGELRKFYPDAKDEDWQLIEAGIRVQVIKKEDGNAGIVHFGTQVVTDDRKTISALLGASPGASVSTDIMLDVVKQCFADRLSTDEGQSAMREMVGSFDQDLSESQYAQRQQELSDEAHRSLQMAV
jgi:malate dehydrogenase (quinone)